MLVDVVDRLGVRADFNAAFSAAAQLTGPYRLEGDTPYSWEEIADRWTRSLCGDEHGLAYFREHGYWKSDRVRDARGPRRTQHVQVVIDEGRALRVEGFDLAERGPETRILLRRPEGM